MDKLESLPSITRLSDYVIRILGQNRGKFTLQGTNTYLVGRHNPYILIDTGEGRDAYITCLEQALRETATIAHPDKPVISDIVITHRHFDHYDGIPSVLTLVRKLWSERNSNSAIPAAAAYKPPRLHKFPSATPDTALNKLVKSIPTDAYTQSPSGAPWHDLSESRPLPIITDDKPSYSILQFIHTPGHTTDSVAIFFPPDKALFTADTVLGYGSTVFEDLRSYLASLQKMYDFSRQPSDDGSPGPKYTRLYPGHGPVVQDGPSNIKTYIKHRQKRDEEILQTLQKTPPGDEPWTTWTLVASIYKDYPENIWQAAAQTLDMHLRKLELEGKVESLGGVGKDVMWEIL